MRSFETFANNLLAVCMLWCCSVHIFSEKCTKQHSRNSGSHLHVACCRYPVSVDSISSTRSSHSAAKAKCVTVRLLDAALQVPPPSPQPSVDRLSVTFAPEERSVCSDSSVRMTAFAQGSPPASNLEKVHFSREPTVTGFRPSFLCNLSFIVRVTSVVFSSILGLQLFLSIVFRQLLSILSSLYIQMNDLLTWHCTVRVSFCNTYVYYYY